MWGTSLLRLYRLLRNESFRLAAVFALLFLAFAAVLMGAVYGIVTDTQRGALMDAVDVDTGMIINGYRAHGTAEAIEVINQRLGPVVYRHGHHLEDFISLQDGSGHVLAGNLPAAAPVEGVYERPVPPMLNPPPAAPAYAPEPDHDHSDHDHSEHDHSEHEHHDHDHIAAHETMLGRGIILGDGAFLFVGRNTHPLLRAQWQLRNAFLWITVAALSLALMGGVLSGVRYMRRIDAIARTCEAIIAGRYSERIALRGNGDELDRLGAAINRMLSRIEALMENLKQVSTDIAHDLRTPLTRLRYRLEHAQQAHSTEAYSREVSRAIADADQALAIFSALLRIAQIEAQVDVHAMVEFSLSDLLRRIDDLYRPVAEDEGHPLHSEVPDNLTIRGDADLLMQLFVNLLENAIRHTPRGTQVLLQARRVDDEAVVEVADHGPGIPDGERDKVLRRFYRLSASRSTPGTGLGLATANAIAQLHHARLLLTDNQPGLRVQIKLPLIRQS